MACGTGALYRKIPAVPVPQMDVVIIVDTSPADIASVELVNAMDRQSIIPPPMRQCMKTFSAPEIILQVQKCAVRPLLRDVGLIIGGNGRLSSACSFDTARKQSFYKSSRYFHPGRLSCEHESAFTGRPFILMPGIHAVSSCSKTQTMVHFEAGSEIWYPAIPPGHSMRVIMSMCRHSARYVLRHK